MTFSDKLKQTKESYPFALWSARFDDGLEQYTPENVNSARAILDRLIDNLSSAGENANEAVKVSHFKASVEALNDLNDQLDGCLIETGEREELCELFDVIASAAGLDPSIYGDGDGIASEWRDW
ncbi:MAG: hypothetical protein HC808_01910 [Candidatus Competibacteraceae bacterium]|nr:hypothetical protein [Candidatus Competibacteraceae bacterium]